MNARWVRRGNHCQTCGIHMCTKICFTKHMKNNKLMNACFARNENHCQTIEIYMSTRKTISKRNQNKIINTQTIAGRVVIIIDKQKEFIGLPRKYYINYMKKK